MNIIFDLDDTLYEIIDVFHQAINDVFSDFEFEDIKVLYQEFRAHSDELFAFSQEQEENLYIMQRERIIRTMKDNDYIIDEQQAQAFHDRYEYLQYHSDLSVEVETLLKDLIAEGHTLGLITNGDTVRQREKIAALKLERYMDDRIIVSGDHGFNKPDTRLFKMMEAMCPSGPFIMIGDSYDNDIEGALESDWSALWINKNNLEIPKRKNLKVIHHIRELSKEFFQTT